MKLIFVSLMVGILEILFLDTAYAVCPRTVPECHALGVAAPRSSRCDADNDRLYDEAEDVNLNCLCDSDESCWTMSDTDADCIPDGLEVSSGTNPVNPDTDGDGLCDGHHIVYGNDRCILGEDLNCDGNIQIFSGVNGASDGVNAPLTETDPRMLDTDSDGINDYDEQQILHSVCDGRSGQARRYTNPADADTDHDGLSDFAEVYRLNTSPVLLDTDFDGQWDGVDTCPCDPSPACTPPPQPVCTNGDAGDAPAVGSFTEIRRGTEILRSEKDSCYPQGRQHSDILKEYYCDPQSGQIMLHWYICKPSACTTNAQGLGSCPASDAHLITNPANIPLP